MPPSSLPTSCSCSSRSAWVSSSRAVMGRASGAPDVARLGPVDVDEAVPFVFETVRLVRKALADRVPLIGFAGAPFTLASYLVEGGPSREFLYTKRFMHDEPAAWRQLMTRLP